jgi:EAL domain-containing protein (putative c-di-GMP-specific phosphodiesterase class I)/ActR/RegA family two-component response regulator
MVQRSTVADTIRVIVPDHHESVRVWLRYLFEVTDDIELVGEAADAAEAVELARRLQPDIAILDVRMPKGGGPEGAQLIGSFAQTTRVLAFSSYATTPQILAMIEAGTCGYVVKGGDPGEVITAVRTITGGDVYLPAKISATVVECLRASLMAGGQRMGQRSRLQNLVDDVLRRRAVTMHYQPIVHLATDHIVGYEALARIDSPRSQPPNEWFEDAKTVGRLAELEQLTIATALAQLDQLPPRAFLAINITPESAGGRMLAEGFDAVPLERIVLEITEHSQVSDYGLLADALGPLRARGLRVAIDDVGAGYSSLSHVVRLAPEIIKIDRSFTAGIETHQGHRSLIAAMRSFADDTGADVLAEGIETGTELETMQTLGVTLGQGYYLGRPQPLEFDATGRGPGTRRHRHSP